MTGCVTRLEVKPAVIGCITSQKLKLPMIGFVTSQDVKPAVIGCVACHKVFTFCQLAICYEWHFNMEYSTEETQAPLGDEGHTSGVGV